MIKEEFIYYKEQDMNVKILKTDYYVEYYFYNCCRDSKGDLLYISDEGEYSVELNQQDYCLYMYVKWDGCSELLLSNQEHYCGQESLFGFLDFIKKLDNEGREYLKTKNGR